jgi:hypothetical protein
VGREAKCKATYGDLTSEGRAQLETDELVFRGDFRVKVPLRHIERVESHDDSLRLRFAGRWLTLFLGAEAEKWAQRIRSPKTVIEKLGVAPGQRALVVGSTDDGFVAQLEARGANVTTSMPRDRVDVVFLGATSVTALDRLARLRDRIVPAGAIWVVWPKGRPELKEDHVRAAALAVGLVDVKVVKFSETHSALKLVIPLKSR